MSVRVVSTQRSPRSPSRAPCSVSGAAWIVRLGECYGDLCAEHRQGAGAGVDAALDRVIRLASQWRSERAS